MNILGQFSVLHSLGQSAVHKKKIWPQNESIHNTLKASLSIIDKFYALGLALEREHV